MRKEAKYAAPQMGFGFGDYNGRSVAQTPLASVISLSHLDERALVAEAQTEVVRLSRNWCAASTGMSCAWL